MKTAHNVSRELATSHMEEAGERSVVDHDKKAFPREYQVGDKVLLKVKNFLDKNAKLAEKWKGPFVITKSSHQKKLTYTKRSMSNFSYYTLC